MGCGVNFLLPDAFFLRSTGGGAGPPDEELLLLVGEVMDLEGEEPTLLVSDTWAIGSGTKISYLAIMLIRAERRLLSLPSLFN